METLLGAFAMIFISMVVLLFAKTLGNGELPTGCTPEGCRNCRKKCSAKAAMDAQTENEKG